MVLTSLFTAWTLLCLGSLALTVSGHLCAHVVLSRRPRGDGPRPPISILKPVRGLDDGLYDNLVALARQRYPRFEILVGAEDPDDPALGVAAQVRRDFPDVEIRLVAGGPQLGHNPKVNNLARLTPLARHPHLLISDSNVRPGPGYLAAIADELADPRVGLVHNVLVGEGERTTGALLENLHLGGFVCASVCAATTLVGEPAVIGKSMLMHRDDLARAGGLAAVKDVLAEDYQLARRIQASGRVVKLSPFRLTTINEQWDLARFLGRHLRWAQMRRRQQLGWYLLEPLGNPVVPLLGLLALSLWHPEILVFERSPARLAVLGVALTMAADAALWHRLRGDAPPLLGLLLMPVKAVLVFALWCVALLRRRVEWRGHWMRIGPQSRLEPAVPAALPTTAHGVRAP